MEKKRSCRWSCSAFAAVALCALALCLVVPCAAFAADAPSAQKQTVRVGFFQFDGYHMENGNGTYDGYGYELLEDLARYNNWDLEFVGYDKSWSQMQDMLADGQIDILTSAQKTNERMARFAFSAEDVGSSQTMLTTKAGTTRFHVGDYSTYNGMRVGMLNGNSRNASFAEFAGQKGFSYTSVYYGSNDELVAALQSGVDIDAAVTSSLRSTDDEWVLDEFDESPFYVMTRLDDTALMAQVDYAIAQLDEDIPDWRSELNRKYYTTDTGEMLSLTAAESSYLAQMRDQGVVFKVAANPDWRPYSYYEDGQMKGILPTIFATVAERAGIDYEFVDTPTRVDYKQAIDSGAVDIVIDTTFGIPAAELTGYQLTDPYMTVPIASLTLRSPGAKTGTICVPQDLLVELELSGTDAPNGAVFVGRDTTQECVDALESGSCDAVYLYSYTARHYTNADERNRLTMALVPSCSVEMRIGTAHRLDACLVSLLDKGVHSVEGGFSTQAILDGLNTDTGTSQSLIGFVYDNPLLVLGTLVVLGLLVAVIVIMNMRRKHERESASRQAEFERFVGYVCQLNDIVMELDLQSGSVTRYLLEDDGVRPVTETGVYTDDSLLKGLVHPDDLAMGLEHDSITALRALAEAGTEDHFEIRLKMDDGQYRWCFLMQQGVPKDEDHPCNVVLLIRDIDDIKREQEQNRQVLSDALISARQASEAKGSFLSRMSHEIRTPLNAVMGYLALAQMPDTDFAQVMHCVCNCQTAAAHLLEIINDVLDVSAIEAGHMKIAHESFDMGQVVQELESIFRAQAIEKGIDFKVDKEDIRQWWVKGDRMRVGQVLSNLLSNALKFTDKGGTVRLVVRQVDVDDAQVHYKFQVQDTGKGMSADYLRHLYEPFEQEDANIAQSYGGSGLGLSITRNLVDMMDGSIDVESELGKGTLFTATFAFDPAEEQTREYDSPVPTSTDEPGDYRGNRVLIVEDNAINREISVEMMHRFNVDIDTASDGQEALEKFQASDPGTYQAIFMDVRMPRLNGYDATRAIRRSKHADAASVPVIAMTANAFTEDVSEALASGMDGHLSKPISLSALDQTLARFMPKRKA